MRNVPRLRVSYLTEEPWGLEINESDEDESKASPRVKKIAWTLLASAGLKQLRRILVKFCCRNWRIDRTDEERDALWDGERWKRRDDSN
jgi:hypothetical protein